MATGTEAMVEWSLCAEKPLCIAWGLEPTPLSLSLAGGLVGQFGAVIQPPVLAVLRGYRRVIEYRTVFLVISLALDVFA